MKFYQTQKNVASMIKEGSRPSRRVEWEEVDSHHRWIFSICSLDKHLVVDVVVPGVGEKDEGRM
jgi:hypothetical protein